jgi:mannose-6-phosphate isomerase-like protein (cupin superfamily)
MNAKVLRIQSGARAMQANFSRDGIDGESELGWLATRPGERCFIRISARETKGLYSLVEIASDPGDGTSFHVHEQEDEQILVLEGTARIACGEKIFDCCQGEVATLRKGILCAWGNRTGAKLRIAIVASTGGVEEILRLTPQTDFKELPALISRFRVKNLGLRHSR